MTFTPYFYRDENDLYAIQKTTAEWIALNGFVGRMNVQDIALRLFAGLYQYDPCQVVRLWKNSDGDIVGWGMLYPVRNHVEVQVHPDEQYQSLGHDILAWAEHDILPLIQALASDNPDIEVQVFETDTRLQSLLEVRGYTRQGLNHYISTCSLDDKLPQPQLPDGFSIRNITVTEEAEKIATLVNAGFGWDLTPEIYQKIMCYPGYTSQHERVVVAPDGQFASSCILLPDDRNRIFMFENVTTHPNFRKLGLAKALLLDSMQYMRRKGFTLAQVPHLAEIAAQSLYTSVGFQPTYHIYGYTRSSL